MNVRMYECMYIKVNICMYVYKNEYMYVCMYVCSMDSETMYPIAEKMYKYIKLILPTNFR